MIFPLSILALYGFAGWIMFRRARNELRRHDEEYWLHDWQSEHDLAAWDLEAMAQGHLDELDSWDEVGR